VERGVALLSPLVQCAVFPQSQKETPQNGGLRGLRPAGAGPPGWALSRRYHSSQWSWVSAYDLCAGFMCGVLANSFLHLSFSSLP
jgi:hypothetical protein